MAQPQQPQPQAPPRTFSPLQHTPSPGASQSAFALPPTKRVRTEGSPALPESPHLNNSFSMSPVASGTPPASAGSPPTLPITQNAPSAYPQTYTNGNTTPSLTLPEARPSPTTPLGTPVGTPQPLSAGTPQYTNATMAPMLHTPVLPMQTPGAMGPPQRPAERPAKEYEYDITDSLAGTGIDLRAEEQFLENINSSYLDREARSGFHPYPPGPKSTFYGAGPANQPPEVTAEEEQKRVALQVARKAWNESAMRLGAQRAQEINNPFLTVALLHQRAEKIAKENQIGLNLDLKNTTSTAGKMKHPNQFPEPVVKVDIKPGPDSAMVSTTSSMIPQDAYLVDQLALLSIATKVRLRDLVEDANGVAAHRQTTSHGNVPEEWEVAAAPMNADVPMEEETNGNPLKRPAETADPRPRKLAKIAPYLITTMRDLARQEREWEEARLRRRQKRKDGVQDTGAPSSRSGSVAPGTPGSVAPEPEKAMTKKELKKTQAAKAAEASNHASQNQTSNMFLGGAGKLGLFGKKKTGKSYSWMNAGGGGSGASTPSRNTPGAAKGLGSVGSPAPGNLAMTTEGRNRLGGWREDKEKGKNIQLRDWIAALERDGLEYKALQKAYDHLDTAGPK